MKQKFLKLSRLSYGLSLLIFALDFFMYHFVTDNGISLVFREEAGKPFVTLLLGILGVLFLFSSILSLLIARIFYSEGK